MAGLGLLVLLYSGLSWFSSMRIALAVVFEVPAARAAAATCIGKLRDLVALLLIGVVLLLAVALTGFVTGFSTEVLDWVGADSRRTPCCCGWSRSPSASPRTPCSSTRSSCCRPARTRRGATCGPAPSWVRSGFEVLKQLSGELLGLTKDKPAFQAFGVALILLVWINFFSRVVILAAAWAHESPASRAVRDALAARTGPARRTWRGSRGSRRRRRSATGAPPPGRSPPAAPPRWPWSAALRRPRRKDNL